MKVFSHPPGEDWIIDRITLEFCHNTVHSLTNLNDCDVIVLFAPWCWKQYPVQALQNKKLIVMMHHIVEDKFNVEDFRARDAHVDHYIVPNEHTFAFVNQYTTKPIEQICYWLNPQLWPVCSKDRARSTFKEICSKSQNSLVTNVDLDVDLGKYIVVGSFQRDTEGSDLKTPKYEKGPDLFIKSIENAENREDLLILLGGWRRQYIISELERMNVKYIHLERPPLEVINLMYDCLDLYIVSSRFEGGPQAIIECAYKNIPIISNDMGIARTILHEECVVNVENNFFIPNESHVKYAHESCLKVLLPNQIKKFDQLIYNV